MKEVQIRKMRKWETPPITYSLILPVASQFSVQLGAQLSNKNSCKGEKVISNVFLLTSFLYLCLKEIYFVRKLSKTSLKISFFKKFFVTFVFSLHQIIKKYLSILINFCIINIFNYLKKYV